MFVSRALEFRALTREVHYGEVTKKTGNEETQPDASTRLPSSQGSRVRVLKFIKNRCHPPYPTKSNSFSFIPVTHSCTVDGKR